MKITVSSFFFLVLLGVVVVGCGGEAERKTATDGADAQAIRDYEAAVAAMEQQDIDSDMEAEAAAADDEPAAQ